MIYYVLNGFKGKKLTKKKYVWPNVTKNKFLNKDDIRT